VLEKLDNNSSSAALSWMVEMELVTNPNVLNAMVLNIFRMVRGVKDAQFVIDTTDKKILIYLELTRWSAWFHKGKAESEVTELIDQVLPAFKKRVVFDKTILEKALQLLKGKENRELK